MNQVGAVDSSAGNIPMYYHGGSECYDVLRPQPSGLLGGSPAVYATPEFALAALFIARELTRRDIGIGTYGEEATLHITEERPGALQELHDISGWVHAVHPRGFHSDVRLGMRRHEFVHTGSESVPVLYAIRVPDVYEAVFSPRVGGSPVQGWAYGCGPSW